MGRSTLVLLVVLGAELAGGVVRDQGEVLGEERDGLDEGAGAALGALHAVVEVQPVAAALAQRVPAQDQQARDVQLLVELLLAVSAQHLTALKLI